MIRKNEALEEDGLVVSRSLERALLIEQWRADSAAVCAEGKNVDHLVGSFID